LRRQSGGKTAALQKIRVALEVEAEAEDAGGGGVQQEQVVGWGYYDFAGDCGACAGNPVG
jgi:hypothetical protein